MRIRLFVLFFSVFPATLAALEPVLKAGEDALKRFFEGKTVIVKIDMPATDDGMDIYPLADRPLDYSRYAGRIRKAGTAVRAGESILITKIKVKKKHLEFQLGGGGWDESDDVDLLDLLSSTGKTQREKNLEKDVKAEKDPAKKRQLQEELDQLKKEREREDARNKAARAGAEEAKKERQRERALGAGSRFNIRYLFPVTAEQLTPRSVMEALEKYVDFPAEEFGDDPTGSPEPAGDDEEVQFPDPGLGVLKKGALRKEVEGAFGKPVSTSERMEGRFKVITCLYQTEAGRVEAEFIEGTLVRYTVKSGE